MNTNNAYLGTNRTNPFNYQKFDLEQITLRRNGLPLASTPIDTRDHKLLFYNTFSALGLLNCCLGITLQNYNSHFIMCFDLTSTQQAAHDFLHPEITNSSVLVELQFSTALAPNVEIFICGIRSSNVFITSDRKLQRTFFLSQQLKNMDELQLQNFILKCKLLKYKFLGVFAADNFPSELPNNVFVIVNASKSDSSGTHWIIICNRKKHCLLCRSSWYSSFTVQKHLPKTKRGISPSYRVDDRCSNAGLKLYRVWRFFCIYLAHLIFNSNFNGDASDFIHINEPILKRFLTHMLFY